MDGFRNRKFIQDEIVTILIGDQPGIIAAEYDLYDVITNIPGKLNIFNILWVEFHNTGVSNLSLINVQGQVVETQIVHEQGHKQISFNLGNLPAGIYMLRLQHNDVTLTERILVKLAHCCL